MSFYLGIHTDSLTKDSLEMIWSKGGGVKRLYQKEAPFPSPSNLLIFCTDHMHGITFFSTTQTQWNSKPSSLFGREKSAPLKFDIVPRERHVFRRFFEDYFPASLRFFDARALKENLKLGPASASNRSVLDFKRSRRQQGQPKPKPTPAQEPFLSNSVSLLRSGHRAAETNIYLIWKFFLTFLALVFVDNINSYRGSLFIPYHDWVTDWIGSYEILLLTRPISISGP